jgi:hypothetical protein
MGHQALRMVLTTALARYLNERERERENYIDASHLGLMHLNELIDVKGKDLSSTCCQSQDTLCYIFSILLSRTRRQLVPLLSHNPVTSSYRNVSTTS